MAKHNPGFITGSTVTAILTGKGEDLLKGGVTFSEQLGAERSGLLDNDLARETSFGGNSATEWGNEYEEEAIQEFEAALFKEVTDKQRQFVDTDNWTACTVDGMADSGNTLIEIKCPFSADVHRLYLLNQSEMIKKYGDQVRFNMMLTQALKGYLISYDPRWSEPCNLVVIEFEADAEWEARCRSRIKQCNDIAYKVSRELKMYKL